MSTLDTVIEMQKRGMTDFEISKTLQSQGISPRDINESLNQAKIKSAVGQDLQTQQTMTAQNNTQPGQQFTGTQRPSEQNQYQSQSYQGNMTAQNPYEQNQQTVPQGQPMQQQYPAYSQQYPQGGTPPGQPSIMEQPAQNNTYPQEALYSEDPYYATGQDQYYADGYGADGYAAGYTDTETITEIAEQVVNEKFKEYHKKTGDVTLFMTMIQDKVNNIHERLTRIENTIDKLQHAVIGKIGEFGESAAMIKKDLENLHNTTSKLMNPLIDNLRDQEKKRHH